MNERTAAIVPARNEASRIAETVRALLADALFDEVIVVDDGSSDATVACAQASGARVIRSGNSRGKGGALAAGVRATDASILAFIDADLGETASIAGALLGPVIAGDADMTIAAPPREGTSGFGLVERFAAFGIRRLTGTAMTRPLSGQRALRRALADPARLAPRFGVEVGLSIDALRAGARLQEITLAFRHARTARTPAGFLHRGRQGIDIAGALASRAFRGRAFRGKRPPR